jgi:hypothetical protein
MRRRTRRIKKGERKGEEEEIAREKENLVNCWPVPTIYLIISLFISSFLAGPRTRYGTHYQQDTTVAEAAVTQGPSPRRTTRVTVNFFWVPGDRESAMIASADDCERQGIEFQQVDKLAAAVARHTGKDELGGT